MSEQLWFHIRKFTRHLASIAASMGFFFVVSSFAIGDENPKLEKAVGVWVGPITSDAIELRVALKIVADDAGKLTAKFDSLDQGVKDLPVDSVRFLDGTLTAEVAVIHGRFVGKLDESQKKIAGTWTQGTTVLPLVLKKKEGEIYHRPQEPKPPFPYRIEEVQFDNRADKVTLAGSLTIPKGKGPFPAIVLITGSGPHDRDESHLGHRPFWVLADNLTRRGIVVLRYDDRGIGKSIGNFGSSTTQDFKRDAAAAFEYLQARSDIDSKRIGLCGHSEGGIIAALVASENSKVAGVVLLASPGVPGEEIIYRQVELMSRTMGATEDAIARQTERQKKLFASMKEDPNGIHLIDTMKTLIATMPSETERRAAEQALPASAATIGSPWFRMFLVLDPRDALRRVACPVLAINGEKDLQVDPEQNLPQIEAALKAGGNRDATLRKLPGINHLLQNCQTGAALEYGQIDETISVAALSAIGDWCIEKMKPHTE
ncbi:MAG: alpha/beta fold hydrolase [Pirellulales bacterium]